MPLRRRCTVIVRGLCLLSVVYLCGTLTVRVLARPVADLWSAPVTFDEALVSCSALGLAGCVSWLAAATTLVVLEAVSDGWVAARLCPAPARRMLLVACGAAALGAGISAPATADAPGTADPRTSTVRTVPVTGLAVPDRAADRAAGRDAGRDASRTADLTTTVRVRAGDSLWRLAERALPADTTADEVARAWRAIHAVNPARIGNDPDLIFPGTILLLPDTLTTERRELR